MAAAAEELKEINRIHDDEPEQAAARLGALEDASLPADDLPLLAFLLNHVLGEKLARWSESSARLEQLAAREDAPLAVYRNWAAAAHLVGNADAEERALSRLTRRSGAPDHVCATLVRVVALNFVADPIAHRADFSRLALQAIGFGPTPFDAGFAAPLNNVTSNLLAASLGKPLDSDLRFALNNGAEAARVFWYRAGQWMQHERADYLCAKVAVRLGDCDAAIAAAERGLALVEANGNDPIERAFLLQPLGAAAGRAGDAARARGLRAQVDALAAGFDADTRKYLAMDARELFEAVNP